MPVDSEGQESKQGRVMTPLLCSAMSGASAGRSEWQGLESCGDVFSHMPGHLGWGDPKAGLSWDRHLELLPTCGLGGFSQLGRIAGLLASSRK